MNDDDNQMTKTDDKKGGFRRFIKMFKPKGITSTETVDLPTAMKTSVKDKAVEEMDKVGTEAIVNIINKGSDDGIISVGNRENVSSVGKAIPNDLRNVPTKNPTEEGELIGEDIGKGLVSGSLFNIKEFGKSCEKCGKKMKDSRDRGGNENVCENCKMQEKEKNEEEDEVEDEDGDDNIDDYDA